MLLLICGLLSVVLLVCSGLPSKPGSIDVEALRPKWKEYQLAAHDPSREKMVRDALSKAAGIYADGKQEIPKTVLIQVPAHLLAPVPCPATLLLRTAHILSRL